MPKWNTRNTESNLNKHLVWLSVRRLFVRPRILRHIHSSKTFPYVIFTTGSVLIWWRFLTTSMLAVWEKSLPFYLVFFFFFCLVVHFLCMFLQARGLVFCWFGLIYWYNFSWFDRFRKPSCIKLSFLLPTFHFSHVRIHLIRLNRLRWFDLSVLVWFPFYSCFTLLSIASPNKGGISFSFFLILLLFRLTYQIPLDDWQSSCITKQIFDLCVRKKNKQALLFVWQQLLITWTYVSRQVWDRIIDCIVSTYVE